MGRKKAQPTSTEPVQTPEIAPHAARASKKGQELTPEEFWRLTKAYPRGAGTQYQLYRKYPVIDRKLSGETKVSIDIQPEMDERYILDHWGTGRYTVYFNDQNGRPSCIANTVLKFDVDWANPPILNQAELVEGPDNRGYIEQLKIRGLWKKRGEEQAMDNAAAATAVQEMAGLAKGVIEQAQKPKPAEVAERTAIDIMGTAYKAAAQTIAETRPAPANDAESSMMAMLIRQMERQDVLLLKLLEGRQAPAPAASIDSQLGVVDKVLAFASRVGGQAAAPSWLDRLPDLLLGLLTLAARGGGGAAAPANAIAPGPVAVGPAAAAVASNPEIDPAAVEAMAQSTGLDATTLQAFLRVGQKGIRAYQEGYSGAAFAELVERTEGEAMYSQLFAVGKDTLLGTLRKLPGALLGDAAAVVQSAAFEAWLDGFMAYGAAEPGAPEEGGKAA